MNRPIKRLLALAGSALIGAFGAVALASPAQAHHTTITGLAVCQSDGKYEITWKVENGNWNERFAKITGLVMTPDVAVDGIVVGSVIKPGGHITGKQSVPGNTQIATLRVQAKWYDKNGTVPKAEDDSTGAARGVTGECKPKPTCVDASKAQYNHTFNGPKGEATVELKGNLPLCEGSKQDFLLVSYYAPGATFGTPQYAFDDAVGTIDATTKKIDLDVDIPPCWTQVDLVWGGKGELIDPLVANGPRYGNKKLGSSGAPGNRSKGPVGAYNGAGTEGRACTTPEATFVSSCDGKVTVHLSNDGKYAATFAVKGDGFNESVSVPAGESKDIVVPAGAGDIVVTEQGKEVGKYEWTRPEDCPAPTLVVESTCDSFTLKVTNPEGGQPAEAKATYGDQSKTVTVAPGETETIVFKAGTTTTAKVTFTGLGLELLGLYEKPGTCGELPVTGDNTTTFIASGTGLAALGALVFFMARRRLVRLRRLAAE